VRRSARACPHACALNIDETDWRLRGRPRAIWAAFTDRYAIVRVAPDSHRDRAKNLLGTSRAIVTSDRCWAYDHLPVKRPQICWSHLQRDFAFHAEDPGIEKEMGPSRAGDLRGAVLGLGDLSTHR
jgi:Transposase IS66 family